MAQHFVGKAILSNFGKANGNAHVVCVTKFLPVAESEIGLRMLPGQFQAKLFGGQHSVKRFIAGGSAAKGLRRHFRLAATYKCARLPIVSGRGEFGIGRKACGFQESIARPIAIAQPPCSKTGSPPALRHPCTGALCGLLGKAVSIGVLILYIETPGHFRAPFGAGRLAEVRINSVEQLLRAHRIVVLDVIRNAAGNRAWHRAIADLTGPDSLGHRGKALQALFAGKRRDHIRSALDRQFTNLVGTRQRRAFAKPCLKFGQFDFR